MIDTKWAIYKTIVMLCHEVSVRPRLDLEKIDFIGRKILYAKKILNFKSGSKGKKWLKNGKLPKKVKLNLSDATVFLELLYIFVHRYSQFELETLFIFIVRVYKAFI